jgi:hypothetical protein
MIETVGDRPGLLEDLDLLGVGPHEVDDPVVGRLSVLQQRRQGRDGLPGAGRRVDEQRASRPGDVYDGADDRFLAGSQTVREQRRRTRGEGSGGRTRLSELSSALPV